jgi:hypothetical protein
VTYWLEPWAGDGPPTPVCTLIPRLTAGASAYVIPGPSNVIRSGPGTGPASTVIGQIPGGAFFYVTGGPQCGKDGRYWWQIRYQGITGWTGEGEGTTYWVSPFVCLTSGPARLVWRHRARTPPPGERAPHHARHRPGSTVIGGFRAEVCSMLSAGRSAAA